MGNYKSFLEEKYKKIYGDGNYSDLVSCEDKKMKKMYCLVISIFVLALILSIVSSITNKSHVKITDNGNLVSINRPKEGENTITVDAKVWAIGNGSKIESEKELTISPEEKSSKNSEESLLGEESEADKLERKVSAAVRSLNYDTASKAVILPKQLDDGTKLVWQENNKSNFMLIIIAMTITLFLMYKNRFENIKKEEKEVKHNIINTMPEFINKMVLLLDAGLVVNQSFEKIVNDYKVGDRKNYFYEQLLKIENKIEKANGILYKELSDFAKRTGVKELMRLSNIITDNINKGADLSENLQRESSALWFARKKQSEEKGRLAETKLTLPLVILLLILVMITIAPALIDM